MSAVSEIVVVDGGSADGSAEVATAHGARVVAHGRPQRAAQLNAGAAASRAPLLWFVHADTLPALSAADLILRVANDPRTVGGAFRRRFTASAAVLRWTVLWGDLRASIFGVSFGDQTQFVRRTVFQRLGGFADCDHAEDMEFALRLRECGRTVCLGPPVVSSARRFAARPWRTVMRDTWLTWRYWRCPPCREGAA